VKNTSAFTLIEMMIVVAVIAIIAAIALPNLLRSRLQANESSAIQDLRVIGSAEITYYSAHSRFGNFAELTATIPEFINAGWVEGREKSGYIFSLPVADESNFECYATPISPGDTGHRYFRTDASGSIRFSMAGQPDETSATLGS